MIRWTRPHLVLTSLFTILSLIACSGGGSSGPTASSDPSLTNNVIYPDCELGTSGTADLAGCWVSEHCEKAYAGGDSPWVRYLVGIIQTATAPSTVGEIKDYYIEYDSSDDECTRPLGIVDVAEQLLSDSITNRTFYKIVSNETCATNIAGQLTQIPCVALDVTVQFSADEVAADPEYTLSTYAIMEEGNRLCVPIGNYDPEYNFDPDFDFELDPVLNPRIGVLFNSGWSAYRVDNISSDDCLTRFIPPV